MEIMLAEAFERQILRDAVLASSEAQRKALWEMREILSLVQKAEGGSIKHDVSVPVSKIPLFLSEATAAVERLRTRTAPVAIHAAVPFVDSLTTILDPELPLTVIEWEEWGDPLHDPEVYAYMKGYTPY